MEKIDESVFNSPVFTANVPQNVAILGCVSHRMKAPFGEPNWEIWAQYDIDTPRWTRWFELHPLDRMRHDPHLPLWNWMRDQDGTRPIYLQKASSEIKGSVAYPRDAIVEKFGAHCFKSTAAWMMALAIARDPKPAIIGIYGIDFSSDAERREQKPGMQALIWQARNLYGIEVVAPDESEILVPPMVYALDDRQDLLDRMERRRKEQREKLDDIRDRQRGLDHQALLCNGILNEIDYQIENWFK